MLAAGFEIFCCFLFLLLQIHTKKRNRLDVHRLNRLVYVQFNAKLFNKQRRVKDKNIDVILEDGDERNLEEWIVEPHLRDNESTDEPIFQAPGHDNREDLDSDEEHDIAIDIEFESDNEQVMNVEELTREEI